MSGFVADTTSYRPWMQNALPTFTPSCGTDTMWGFTPGVYGWGTTGSSSGSTNSAETLEEYQRKEAKELRRTKAEATKKKEAKEIESSGLAITKAQQEHVKDVAKSMEEDKVKGCSILEEMGMFTAFGAVGAVGMSPISNSKTYLFGKHNHLFSKATDIYTYTNTNGKKITYNQVYKANSKLMGKAKAAMRKAERLNNKWKWKGRLGDNLYKKMSNEMKSVLKELAKDPNNEVARTKLKNLTEAINKTTSQRVGWIRSGWTKLKNNTVRKWLGKPSLKINQPNVKTFKDVLRTVTTNSQTAGQTASVASKGMSILKGAGKLVKKAPWLVGAFEVFADKDLISAAYKKDTATGNKQLGKTAFKAAGAMAGMALGIKAGALIGSIVPGAGTVVGGIIGGLAGFAIGGALSWLGREGGKWLGDMTFGEDIGVKAKAENISKAGTQEQLTEAIETVTWARENKDKLTKAELDSISVLEKNLVAGGHLQPMTA